MVTHNSVGQLKGQGGCERRHLVIKSQLHGEVVASSCINNEKWKRWERAHQAFKEEGLKQAKATTWSRMLGSISKGEDWALPLPAYIDRHH